MLTTAALATAMATGPASAMSGTATQIHHAMAHAVPAAICWPKVKCGDDCCVQA
jgi:hypothetical protein